MKNPTHPTRNVLSVLLLLAIPMTTFAQGKDGSGRDGHGGEVLACFTSVATKNVVYKRLLANRKSIYKVDPLTPQALAELNDRAHGGSVELIDLYLARRPNLNGEPEALITSNGPFQKVLKERLDRVDETNYPLSNLIKSSRKLIDTDRWVSSSAGVIELDDAMLALIFPEKCLPLQIANQQILNDQIATVNYDERLFKLLNPIDQAALVVHEWVYNGLVREQHANDARSTQITVKTIFHQNFKSENAQQINEVLVGLGISKPAICYEGICTYREGNSSFFLSQPPIRGLRISYAGQVARGLNDPGSYRYREPVEFRGFFLKTASFDRDEIYPYSASSDHPIPGVPFPLNSDSEAYQIFFEKPDFKVKRIETQFSQAWSHQGFDFPANTSVWLDAQYRVIGIASDKNPLPGTWNGFKCIEVGFTYAANSNTPIISYCIVPSETQFAGLSWGGKIPFTLQGEIDISSPIEGLTVDQIGTSIFENGLRNVSMKSVVLEKLSSGQFVIRSFNTYFIANGARIKNVDCKDKTEVKLYANGNFQSCTAVYISTSTFHYESGNQQIVGHLSRNMSAESGKLIELHPNGKVKTFTAGEAGKIRGIKVLKGQTLTFDENESLISVQ